MDIRHITSFSDLCPSLSQFHYSKEPVMEATPGGWIQAKNAPWTEVVNRHLLRTIETGIFIRNGKYFRHVNMKEEDCLDKPKLVLAKYALSYAKFPFCMLVAGYCTSMLALVIECLHFKWFVSPVRLGS